MPDGDYILIFRSMSTEDLNDRKETLLEKMTTISSMGVGSKTFTRDLRQLKDQLAAITFVLKERTTPYKRYSVFDFSGSPLPTNPSGTTENL